MKSNRTYGFILITILYALAILLSIFIFKSLNDSSIYLRIFIADVAATVFIYLAGLVLKNASVYDAYWSVQPIVISIGMTIYYGQFNLGIFLLLFAICFWGIRLTVNWAITFKNLEVQDWRYDMFKEKFPRIYPLISLFGIHLFPTVMVYLALLPAIAFIGESAFNLLTILGFVICIAATLIQMLSDKQMQQFRRERKSDDDLIRIGLWRNSRHPNYFGEIMMWWGVYVMMLSATPEKWNLIIGPIAITAMFLIVSIPMADKRNGHKEGFAQYVKETRSLLPIRRKSSK